MSTGCLQMPKGIFGVTGTPVYDPPPASSTSPWPTGCGRSTSTPACARTGWPVALPMDSTTSTCGARSRSATGTSTSASRPTATAGPTPGACSRSRRARARSTTPGRPSTPRRAIPAGAASGAGAESRSRATATSGRRSPTPTSRRARTGSLDHAESVVELNSALGCCGRATRRHADQGRLRLRVDARRLQVDPLRPDGRRRGQGRRGLPLEARRRSPQGRCSGSSWRSRPRSTGRRPGIRRRSSCSSRPPGLRRRPSGLDALALTAKCRLRWPGRRASAVSSAPSRPSPTTPSSSPREPGTCACTPRRRAS